MLDGIAYRKVRLGGVGEIGKLSAGTVQGYTALAQAGAKTG